MDEKWRETLATEGRALVDDTKAIRTRDKEELWEAYLTFLAQKMAPRKITKDEFMTELGWLVPE